MTKAILLSVKPEHARNILNGKKTLELRKSVPQNFVGWVYIYVTKGKKRLSVVHDDENGKTYYYVQSNWGKELNELVVARFWFDEYEAFDSNLGHPRIYTKACVDDKEMPVYFNGKLGYAWHIKNLEIFDKPMELGDFRTVEITENDYLWEEHFELKTAPKGWRYVWVD